MRDMPVLFGSNTTLTVALPSPDAASAKVIHETVDVALQVQPEGVVTAIVWVPPMTFKLEGATMMLQTAPA
jgi:hypothetical protein